MVKIICNRCGKGFYINPSKAPKSKGAKGAIDIWCPECNTYHLLFLDNIK